MQFVRDRTLLITRLCMQIQLSPSVWDDVRDDVATVEGWLHCGLDCMIICLLVQ